MKMNDGKGVQGAEIVLTGVAASPGIAMGSAVVLSERDFRVPLKKLESDQVDPEIARLERAIAEAKSQLMETRQEVARDMGESYARIFDAYIMILEDQRSMDDVRGRIRKGHNAEFAFNSVFLRHEKDLWSKGDVYVRDRAGDVRDVRRRVLSNLSGLRRRSEELSNLENDVIVIANDLSPADTARMRRERILAFATDIGGRTSHTAIMARSLEIPAVVGLKNVTSKLAEGDFVIVDGNRGKVIAHPSTETRERYGLEIERYTTFTAGLLKFRDLPAVSIDGHSVILSANIESHEEVDSVLEHGAEGIGLYRTEFIYIGREGLPGEEEQFQIYRSVAERAKPHPVIIRTMDLGGDKFISPLESPKEINPYLGWRGIRFSLARKDIFRAQLRAILRSSAYGNVKIMYPMISGLDELLEANAVLAEVKEALKREGHPLNEDCEVGIMVETPAAVMIAPELAPHVDFFSIGSNDLIQYTLAADRGNEKVAYLYEPLHPAVLRLIRRTIQVARDAKIWVGLCGEMSSDLVCAYLLLGMGIDELSASPYVVPEIKEMVRAVYFSEAEEAAERALAIFDPADVRRMVLECIGKEFPDMLL
jgi:phosphotransferase system enzyme I (PtsI)